MRFTLVATALALGLSLAPRFATAAPQPPLPTPASTTTVGSIQVQTFGTPGKPAVVFIPGLTCGPWEFAREIALLAPDHAVYALTLPGFDGLASISTPLFPTVTADFWTFLQTEHVVKPVVIGHSLGGTMAIALATQHPERLAGVIAIDGYPVFPGEDKHTPAQRAQDATQISAMLAKMTSPQEFAYAEKTYALPYMITASADVDSVAALTAKSDPQAAAAWMMADTELDLRADLSKITIPLVEIIPFDPTLDPRDPEMPLATAQAKQQYVAGLLANAPTAQVRVISPSRHFIMYDQPAAFDALLVQIIGTMTPG